ncbi:MAG: hypothetical protein ACYC2Y_05420 [Armatimonadota bacterium]
MLGKILHYLTAPIGQLVIAASIIAALGCTARAQDTDVRKFLESVKGDWVGTCEQSTDGEPAENKYFHAIVKQTGENTYESNFEYYRWDEKTDSPLHIGDARIVTEIAPDGSAKNAITGNGTMLVDNQPKKQEHQLSETLSVAGEGTLRGAGDGKITVYGLPLGLGKNGSIRTFESTWTLKDDVLTVSQKLEAGFKVLLFTKRFDVEAKSVARRGSDVVRLMKSAKVGVASASN